MSRYSTAEAASRLSELVDAANTGESVTLTRSGRPVAVLQPVAASCQGTTPEMLELLSGSRKIWLAKTDDATTLVRDMRDEIR